ncbi:MAG: flagellar type III secretion system pore protein FliP [Oscillospiraceae bacterium]|jgi:flagellar biosynthetic protein FliP|nr:flagellar type III secretion system pore protein FliP [Oscillospiraceae bacterium]
MKRNIAPVRLLETPGGLRLTEPVEPKTGRETKCPAGRKKALAFVVSLLLTAAVTRFTASAAINDIVTSLFGESTQTVDIIILLTVLTVLPSIVLMMTGFTRILIVLSFIRHALGMQQTPPNQVLIGLALFLTFFVMSPILSTVYNDAYIPYVEQEIEQDEFIERVMAPTQKFMLDQVYDTDLDFFIGISNEEVPDRESVPNKVLIPAFITSEIKHAFVIGFLLYVPFIIIDMVVASTLMAMGMMMLPPAMISLPFKVLLFVLVDGWQLVLGSLIGSFRFL